MSRIIVLSHGTHTSAREVLPDTMAIVVSGMSTESAELFASIFNVPFTRAEEFFSLSAQSLRFPPTRTIVREKGVALYYPLSDEWLKRSNWPLARGNSSALLTAYVLALSLGAFEIEYRLGSREEVVPLNHFLLKKLTDCKIGLRYLT